MSRFKSASQIKVINAFVINGKKRHKVPTENIVDSSVTLNAYGFDSMNVVKIAFPWIKVGSLVEIEYIETAQEKIFKDHFSNLILFGIEEYRERSHVEIISDREVFHDINDPWKVLHVESGKNKKGKFFFSIKLKRPFGNLKALHAIQMETKKLTFVLVSTDTDWNKVSHEIRLAYEKIISTPLTLTLQKIADKTMKKKSLKDKVNYAVSQIIKKFNYVGDWRTVNGQLIPKGLKELEKTGYGDCKDFSTSLTAILRKAGVDAYVAWVQRGSLAMKNYYNSKLVYPYGYNHAIVFIREGSKEYWVDPTNSYANGLDLNDDIALSEALVLKKNTVEEKRLPSVNMQDHRVDIDRSYVFKTSSKTEVEGRMKLTGRYSAKFVQLKKKEKKAKIEQAIINLASFGAPVASSNVKPFSLNDTINEELDFSFKYTMKYLDKSRSFFISLPVENYSSLFKINAKKSITKVFLGTPYISTIRVVYKNVHFAGKKEPICNVDSKWLALNFKIDQKSDSIVFNKELMLKRHKILQSELKSTEYKILVQNLARCYNLVRMPVQMGKSGSRKPASLISKKLPLKKRVEQRNEIALKIIDKGIYDRYNEAVQLLQENLKEDPLNEDTYLHLETIVKRLGSYRGENYSSDGIAQASLIVDNGISKIGKTPKLLLKKSVNMYLVNKDKGKALKLIEEAQKKQKNRDYQYLRLLSISYYKIGDEDNFLSVVKELKGKISSKIRKKNHYILIGDFYVAKKNWGKCVDNYQMALKQVPDDAYWDASLYNSIGACLHANRQYDEAIFNYKKSLSLNPSFDMVKKRLALGYLDKGKNEMMQKKIKQAKMSIEQSLNVRPVRNAYYNLAIINFMEDEEEKALENIDKYIEMGQGHDSRINVINTIMSALSKIGREKIQKISNSLLKMAKDGDVKLYFATLVLMDIASRKDYNMKKVDEIFSIIEKIRKENSDMVKNNNRAKIDMAFAYIYVAVIKNDISLYEESMKLVDDLNGEVKEDQMAIALLKQKIAPLNHKIGRKPASFFWKIKKKLHVLLQENFKYDLIDLRSSSI